MDRQRIKRAFGAVLVAARLRDPFRQALVSGDVKMLQRIWPKVTGQPAPTTVQEAEAQMHIARTASKTLPERLRCYSHWWLVERGLPSMLPNDLMPKADQHRPNVQAAVGIALRSEKEWLRPALRPVRAAMEQVVVDNQELIEGDPELLKDKILFAKGDEFKRLFGVATAKEVER